MRSTMKKYGRWLAGWREGGKPRKVYLGSCKNLSRAGAQEKARRMKASMLRLQVVAEIALG
jgi:hypothetical protein